MALQSTNIYVGGGTGGHGGQGGTNGGDGGIGEGPTLTFEGGTIQIVINQGTEMEEVKKILRRDFLNWLSPINFFLRQADVSQLRTKGTGGWLIEHPVFKQWEYGSGKTLWCRGIPGSGKTVLASMVVDHLSAAFRNTKDIGVACIYLNHKEIDTQTPSRLLAGLWRQLVLNREISSIAENLYKQHHEKGTAPSLEEVGNILKSSITELSRVFFIIDAMDEYPELQRDILLQHLVAMGSKMNLIITSRPNVSPEPFSLPNLETLDIQAAQEDIQEYVDAQIKLSSNLSKHILKKPVLHQEIHAKITDAVDGMFLLAKLHIESLRGKLSVKAVQEALKHLPKGLDAAYDSVMKRIEDQGDENKKVAYSTLAWVVNAKRPITVSEIQTALAVEPDSQELDEDNVMDIETILSVCAGLVMVDKESSVVRLVHYTTYEYLDSIQAQKFPDAQTEITRTLLTFLNFDGFPKSSWTNSWHGLPPLVEYSQYCLVHAAGQPEVQLRKILFNFFRRAFQWRQTLAPQLSFNHWNSVPWNYSDWPSQPSALWIAAAANLLETAQFLLKEGPTPYLSNSAELGVASYHGHFQMVQLLVKLGADVNAAGGRYGCPLQAASHSGQIGVIQLLIECGANVNLLGGKYGSALQTASYRGHKSIVQLLIEHGADVNMLGGKYGTALQAASRAGHINVVQLLIERGANVNAESSGSYRNSLQAASYDGHINIVQLLLEQGANPNAQGGLYGSALQIASYSGHSNIVQLLIEHGADVNAQGGKYGSALQAALWGGDENISQLLIENGAQ